MDELFQAADSPAAPELTDLPADYRYDYDVYFDRTAQIVKQQLKYTYNRASYLVEEQATDLKPCRTSSEHIRRYRGGNCVDLSKALQEALLEDVSIASYVVPATLPEKYRQEGYPHYAHAALIIEIQKDYMPALLLIDPGFHFTEPVLLPENEMITKLVSKNATWSLKWHTNHNYIEAQMENGGKFRYILKEIHNAYKAITLPVRDHDVQPTVVRRTPSGTTSGIKFDGHNSIFKVKSAGDVATFTPDQVRKNPKALRFSLGREPEKTLGFPLNEFPTPPSPQSPPVKKTRKHSLGFYK